MYDVIIKNGRVYDGSGNPWINADIGVKDGMIVSIGKLKGSLSNQVIDASGLVVSPGFIDLLSNYEAMIFEKKLDLSRIEQGVTTAVSGNIGISYAPVDGSYQEEMQEYLSMFSKCEKLPGTWHRISDFLDYIENQPNIINLATMVGHGTIRMAVVGKSSREPTCQELQRMKQYLADAMEDGAFGMSGALALYPGFYSKTDEMVELSKVVAEKNGFGSIFIRSEGDNIHSAVKEVIEISKNSGAPINISHLGITGRNNWGKSMDVIEMIDEARKEGTDITADIYPYIASSYQIRLLLPPWVLEGGNDILSDSSKIEKIKRQINEGLSGWENFAKRAGWENVIVSGSKNKLYEGKSLKEIAERLNYDPADAIIDMVVSGEEESSIVIFERQEDDVTYLMKQPYTMIASASFPQFTKPHPRCFGTYPRLLSKYVRERKVLTLEDAIRKATSLPALRLGLRNRGLIREGMSADITVFDPDKIEDLTNYVIPEIKPIGIRYVMVNGRIVLDEGCWTENYGGRVLRKGIST